MTALRTDIVEVYVFRRSPRVEFLQLRRRDGTMKGTWQPVMGHVEAGETASMAAARELREETGLDVRSPGFLGWWALEGVHPYYLPALDAVILSPRFAAEVDESWIARLDEEHDQARWIPQDGVRTDFMWPGQVCACEEVETLVLSGKLPRLN
jgi:dATP pyrophosphohydrolase